MNSSQSTGLSPSAQAEIEAVAVELERFGMRRNASRLRAALGDRDDERPCPIQEAQGGQIRSIPWGLAEILYPAYGHDQTLERMAERGGFSRGELGMLAVGMYSGWPGQVTRSEWASRMPLLTLYDIARRGA